MRAKSNRIGRIAALALLIMISVVISLVFSNYLWVSSYSNVLWSGSSQLYLLANGTVGFVDLPASSSLKTSQFSVAYSTDILYVLDLATGAIYEKSGKAKWKNLALPKPPGPYQDYRIEVDGKNLLVYSMRNDVPSYSSGAIQTEIIREGKCVMTEPGLRLPEYWRNLNSLLISAARTMGLPQKDIYLADYRVSSSGDELAIPCSRGFMVFDKTCNLLSFEKLPPLEMMNSIGCGPSDTVWLASGNLPLDGGSILYAFNISKRTRRAIARQLYPIDNIISVSPKTVRDLTAR